MDIVDKIKELEKDLHAYIVVQNAIGHDEAIPGSDRGSGPCSFDKVWDYEYVVTSPAVTKPDSEKNERAKRELTALRPQLDAYYRGLLDDLKECRWYEFRKRTEIQERLLSAGYYLSNYPLHIHRQIPGQK